MIYSIPPHMLADMQQYVEHGTPVGGFLSAVISNDLKEACAMADNDNQRILWEYVHWFWNYAPSNCWGSQELYEHWIEVGGLAGLRGVAAEEDLEEST